MIVNIETYTDADFVRSFIYKTALAGTPIDITDYSLRFMVRARADDPTVYVEATTFNSLITVTDAVNGAFTLRIPVEQLVVLQPGVYVHSMILTSKFSLLRKDIWRGTLTHAAGPTRWKLGTL